MTMSCRYQQALSRRGLHKTALEVCKLLLALNPGDPMGALFAIDYLAGEGPLAPRSWLVLLVCCASLYDQCPSLRSFCARHDTSAAQSAAVGSITD